MTDRRRDGEITRLVSARSSRPLVASCLGCGLGHYQLGEDVTRRHLGLAGVQPPGPDGDQQRRALDQLVAGERVEPALGRPGPAVVRAAHPLKQKEDGARRPYLEDQVYGADGYAELQ